jgi:hypothetical protein
VLTIGNGKGSQVDGCSAVGQHFLHPNCIMRSFLARREENMLGLSNTNENLPDIDDLYCQSFLGYANRWINKKTLSKGMLLFGFRFSVFGFRFSVCH